MLQIAMDVQPCISPHCAAENGHTATVTLLLDCGADVNAQSVHGRTALHLVNESGLAAAIALISCGANIANHL